MLSNGTCLLKCSNTIHTIWAIKASHNNANAASLIAGVIFIVESFTCAITSTVERNGLIAFMRATLSDLHRQQESRLWSGLVGRSIFDVFSGPIQDPFLWSLAVAFFEHRCEFLHPAGDLSGVESRESQKYAANIAFAP